ncbi:MAG: hypothetical protein KGZ25_10180 [Planctomycetes bacterium]|nr:hypothetical protein [Planctomycetota bacterium]
MGQHKNGKNIVLGVSGSIAAYKSCSVLRGLMDRGHQVKVVMTEAAQKLVTPTTFRSLSGRPVTTGLWVPEGQANLVHIELAEWVDLVAIVPATANIIAKITWGFADEILSTTWLACDCPKLVAPAMNDRMWKNFAVVRNVHKLGKQADVHIVDPVEGKLASGKHGAGHLAPVEQIVEEIHSLVSS